eukprot:1184350-Prorocentrum_minimum.AAC.4
MEKGNASDSVHAEEVYTHGCTVIGSCVGCILIYARLLAHVLGIFPSLHCDWLPNSQVGYEDAGGGGGGPVGVLDNGRRPRPRRPHYGNNQQRLVRRENMPALPASDWSAVRICLHFLRLIGPP